MPWQDSRAWLAVNGTSPGGSTPRPGCAHAPEPTVTSSGTWRRAVREARTPWEAAYFGRGLARYLMVVERPAEALSVMQELLEGLELRPTDRDWLESELAVLELRYPERGTNRRGYERGLWLIRTARLSPDALDHLVRQMWLSGVPDDPAWYRLELALESQSSRTRAALLAELWLERGDDGHARSIAMAQGDEGLVEKLQSLQDFAGRLRAGVVRGSCRALARHTPGSGL